ncbi:MAG: hypothetical protein Q8Q02_16255 [Nocardioides sp.]|nr:hypothetical protein [Nocardioides sp.]
MTVTQRVGGQPHLPSVELKVQALRQLGMSEDLMPVDGCLERFAAATGSQGRRVALEEAVPAPPAGSVSR